MDITTILGSLLGLSLIIIAIVTEGSLLTFWSFSSVLVVLGGIIAATLINYPLAQIISVMKVVRIAFKGEQEKPIELIEKLNEDLASLRNSQLKNPLPR